MKRFWSCIGAGVLGTALFGHANTGDAAAKDPAARGLDVFVHGPMRGAPGSTVSLQAQVFDLLVGLLFEIQAVDIGFQIGFDQVLADLLSRTGVRVRHLADELHVTPSAVSHRIRQLEATLEQVEFFEINGYLGPLKCDADWQRIVVPLKKGRNLHLTEPYVFDLCSHPSIVARAAQHLGRKLEMDRGQHIGSWRRLWFGSACSYKFGLSY